jgi:hypothetical protein
MKRITKTEPLIKRTEKKTNPRVSRISKYDFAKKTTPIRNIIVDAVNFPLSPLFSAE